MVLVVTCITPENPVAFSHNVRSGLRSSLRFILCRLHETKSLPRSSMFLLSYLQSVFTLLLSVTVLARLETSLKDWTFLLEPLVLKVSLSLSLKTSSLPLTSLHSFCTLFDLTFNSSPQSHEEGDVLDLISARFLLTFMLLHSTFQVIIFYPANPPCTACQRLLIQFPYLPQPSLDLSFLSGLQHFSKHSILCLVSPLTATNTLFSSVSSSITVSRHKSSREQRLIHLGSL